MIDAAALAERLGDLEVSVEAAFARPMAVLAIDYPGGLRPSGVLSLSGRGCLASGELVAFDEAAQQRFAAQVAGRLAGRRGRVAELAGPPASSEGDRLERAALESALVDLALRQAGRSLAELATSPASAALEYVLSFEAVAAPAARAAELRQFFPSARFKVDVDPGWSAGAIAGLVAIAEQVAILDFKGRGSADLAEELAARLPAALLEDPPADWKAAEAAGSRVARDRDLLAVADVVRAVEAGHAVNLKPARMGGPLSALAGFAVAAGARRLAYAGGMFEVGVGRRQARALAALVCASAPNDLAPLRGVEPRPLPGPLPVRLDRPGFGA